MYGAFCQTAWPDSAVLYGSHPAVRFPKSAARKRRLAVLRQVAPTDVDEAVDFFGPATVELPSEERDFLAACLSRLPLRLSVSNERTGETEDVIIDRPWAVIGGAENCDLRILHPDVSQRHLYLQFAEGRLFCCDLASRTGTHWGNDSRSSGWLEPGEPIYLGPYSIQAYPNDFLADEAELPAPSDGDPAAGDCPPVAFTIANVYDRAGRPKMRRIRRSVTLAGSSQVCPLRLSHASVGGAHCSFVWTSSGLWVIDLLCAGGTWVNGKAASLAHLRGALCRVSTTTRATGASTPSPTPARSAVRRSRCSTVRASRSAPDGARDLTQAAAWALRDGAIVAVKGIGGFHLGCRADDERAVATLRARKHREDKPFALMAGSIEAASSLVMLGRHERDLLVAPERPIVLAPRARGAAVADSVAPGARELGVMLPYSPLHHLLLADAATPLVMTSGNRSDEPIAYHDDDALGRLAPLADLLLLHDRPIQTRTDDSVVRVLALAGRSHTSVLRRSRGYVPASLPLPGGTRAPVLACGGEQKNTFCLAKGQRAWVGHHIGDLENYETLRSFVEGIEHFQRLFAVEPQIVAHDLHPEYLSTKYALERDGVELVGVQHHHAHLAACLAEHGEDGIAIGAIFDGTGYGADGTVWGGEFLCGDLADFRRVGMLAPVALPGGARAIREPWRMACAWLGVVLGDEAEIPPNLRAWSTSAGGVRCRRSFAAVSTLRSPRASADCSTPPPPCAECVPPSTTRVRRRSSWRPCATPRSGVLPDRRCERRTGAPARSSRDDPGARRRRSCRDGGGGDREPVPRCHRQGDGGDVRAGGIRSRHRSRRALGRRVPEPPPARVRKRRSRRRRSASPHAGPPSRQRWRHRLRTGRRGRPTVRGLK